MVRSILTSCIVVVGCILAAGCATAPIQEMSDARQSLQAAHDAGAEKYAATKLHNAELALAKAKEKLEDRAFKDARINAITAKTEALDAQEIAVAIVAAKDAVSEAVKNGVATPEAEELLRQAEQAGSQGDKDEALSLANKAKLAASPHHDL